MARCLLGLLLVALVACATPTPPGPAPTALPAPAPASGPAPPRPDPAEAALERGRSLLAQGDLVAAATVLREAVRLDPGLADARVTLGVTLWELGDLDGPRPAGLRDLQHLRGKGR